MRDPVLQCLFFQVFLGFDFFFLQTFKLLRRFFTFTRMVLFQLDDFSFQLRFFIFHNFQFYVDIFTLVELIHLQFQFCFDFL